MACDADIETVLAEVTRLAKREAKLTGFCIGNTRKVEKSGWYVTPIRNTARLVAGSVIVYQVRDAARIGRLVDGIVDYVLVDTEKKITPAMYGEDDVGNVERVIREVVHTSTILTYKGNDITVDSIEGLLVQLLGNGPRGIGGKKVAIIGAGNIGSKLALKLVERGAHVVITRRTDEILETIVRALNWIKPKETIAEIVGTTNNEEAVRDADALIATTEGTPVITASMVKSLAPGALLIDGGKGCLFPEAIRCAERRGLAILRVDIRPGFEGYVAMLLEAERILRCTVGRRQIDGINIVSGGLLAHGGEIVVDNVYDPEAIYGIADGMGDFVRHLSTAQSDKLEALRVRINALKHEMGT
ncbi:MAG: NAD(P)-binding domain-containing protein [Deltaproteobacteria bacterium]|nr:NAD(P)-binding domain-containing protein [Deltaproteobacteria bacterium]